MSTPAGFSLKKKELWRRTQGVKYCIAEGIELEEGEEKDSNWKKVKKEVRTAIFVLL
jgi:hypothetical protein